ncbi:ATP-dependent DNA helicase PIF1 [Lingula anatina]|uniref:ATP-dependent DNA helicase PIF1 n=1 Tax=Lingula anatina TaxID=7574 RepID=A0A1S3IUL6_LINAN|nr:ATP-dependent DNA helicase PIF1 [Lingula anatina]|eukprot:XP_013401768.1 ATP-dependent DNA helicase PIF1 [Lingula anatina]
MEDNHGELVCTVCMEHLSASGEVITKSLHKNATLILGRNEFQDIVLKVALGKTDNKYIMKQFKVHHKFAKEGKATIMVLDKRIRFLLSNSPPDRLKMFLRCLSTKYECLKHTGIVGERKRFLSELPRTFQEISPLSMKDVQTVHNIRTKQANQSSTLNLKRKRQEAAAEKENLQPKNSKVAKLDIGQPGRPLPPQGTKLTADQTKVLRTVLGGRSIFFTGSAGTGKSYLLRRIIGALPPHHTYATASTGLAACHIGGTTLHSFAGIGSGKAPIEQCVELANRPVIAKQWRQCNHLIIDEVSMVDGEFFSKLETVARVMKKSNEPFGGIQLILCGDFLQLPPVTKGQEKKNFCFQSRAWHKCISVNMELRQVMRQSDKKFVEILQEVRQGRCPEFVEKTLHATSKHVLDKDGIQATRLCTHKEDVGHINQMHLDRLKGEVYAYQSSDSDQASQGLLNTLCPVGARLELKMGAQVMLLKNLDAQRGLVNGARGVVTGFNNEHQGLPVVKFIGGVETTVRFERWTVKASGGMHLTRRQLPLQLAWAISIHKSQGMTLDCVEMSLSRVFESGQAYVALSRAKSLQGLRVLDFEKDCVRANPEVLTFYRNIQLHQRVLQAKVDDFM